MSDDEPETLADIVESQVLELERLRALIGKAPHDSICQWPIRGERTCWKREALEGAR